MATIALSQQSAQARPWWRRLVRVGYAAKGIIYLLIGGFALQLALGDGGRLTDSSGVLGYITGLPFGTPLLALIGVGLIAYALWQITDAFVRPLSADSAKAREVAARIEAGTVWINKHGNVDPRIPFGGAKQSGYGLEFGVEGLKHLGAPQVING